jgi:biotin carboxylase
MNILNIQLPKNHFHTLLHFAQNKEHNVYSNWHGSTSYENACGIHTLTEQDNHVINSADKEGLIKYIEKFINYYDIDILQVADPRKAYLHTHFQDKVQYIGPSEIAAQLETDKLFSKRMADTVGVKTPGIIKQGKYSDADYGTNLTFPAIEKPANVWSPAVNLFNEADAERAIEKVKSTLHPQSGDTSEEYFIEEYIDDMIETNVFFVIVNGEYRITHTQEIIGENLNKTIDQKVWYIGSYIKPLKPEVDIIVRKEAKAYLEKIANMGGNYEGSFCGAYTSTGECYFLEMNVRPDIFNSTPTFMTGEDYIKGMTDDISLIEKAWKDKTCDKLLITNVDKNEEYPMNLHEKHNVSVPNNLEYKDNKFYVSDYGTNNGGCGTVVADHDISKEFIKEVEETTTWTFNKDPNG